MFNGSTAGIALYNSNLINMVANHFSSITTGISETSSGSNQIDANLFGSSVTTPLSGISATTSVGKNFGLNPSAVFAQGAVTGATTFDRTNGDLITATQTGNITVTLTNGKVSGDSLTLEIVTGGFTQTWPSNLKLAGGSCAMTGTSSLTMRWDGTNWRETSRAPNQS